jgi:hypothetical protein
MSYSIYEMRINKIWLNINRLHVLSYHIRILSGADLGYFVPQSNFFGRRGVIGAGRGRLQAGRGEWALNDFYADCPPLDF